MQTLSTPGLACLGNYAPRQCGIATFTTDLTQSLSKLHPETQPLVLAVSDQAGYTYPEEVRLEIAQESLREYLKAASMLNSSDADALLVQHEYGIYGGEAGSHLLHLLRQVNLPVVTTFHTILEHPSKLQRDVLAEIAELSARVVTMSARGHEFLQTVYGVAESKIDFIHHGIPDVPFGFTVDKTEFGLEGRRVLLTFGLLSQNKGVETAIRALPELARSHPDLLYLVLGATHPHILKREGERYRDSLKALARDLGVSKHVRFENKFVSFNELVRYLALADVYVTPYLNREQITSGTLAYAVGMGKAVVSTPYWYAEELLAGGRGVLVPFKDSAALGRELNDLLGDDARRLDLRKRAYAYGRTMTWAKGAEHYLESVRKALRVQKPSVTLRSPPPPPRSYPEFQLSHIETLSDDTGIFQHAVHSVPNPNEGYTTDDNARALMLTTLAETLKVGRPERLHALSHRYLAFLLHAFNSAEGRFRNFMRFDRRWCEQVGSENAHARTLRALTWTRRYSGHQGLRRTAKRLFDESLGMTRTFSSPRAWALTLLALCEGPDDEAQVGLQAHASLARDLANRLIDLYYQNAQAEWNWLEDHLCYSNAKLPHALLLYAHLTGDAAALEVGVSTLHWLAAVQRDGDTFAPVGSDRVYRRGGAKPPFDQQPIEAYASVSAYLAAHRVTGDPAWQFETNRALAWFLGANILGTSLVDAATGGCYDGLHRDRVNLNQGAESTLALWLALLEYRLYAGTRAFARGERSLVAETNAED